MGFKAAYYYFMEQFEKEQENMDIKESIERQELQQRIKELSKDFKFKPPE